MRRRKHQLDAGQAGEGTGKRRRREGRGWGPFTGGQLTAIIITLSAVIGGPVIASAAIPDGNTYHACALKSSGALRVVDPSKHHFCRNTEYTLSWSKAGPPGPRGAPGARGTTGAPGSARAYAYVDKNGTVEAPRSKNISVQEDSSDVGVYCVNVANVDPATIAPIVTVSDTPLADGAAGNWSAFVTLDPTILSGEKTSGDCASVPDFLVIIQSGGPGWVPQDFTISVP